jgi:hypothetical protein
MSRAFVIDSRIFRRKQRKPRTAEEDRFMRFFGATDLFHSYSKDADMLIPKTIGMDIDGYPDVPLSSSVPMGLDDISLIRQAEARPNLLGDRERLLEAEHRHPIMSLSSGAEEPVCTIQRSVTEDVEDLVTFLKDMGHTVQEVKTLPSGVTRISVKDLIAAQKVHEPELVRIGSRI